MGKPANYSIVTETKCFVVLRDEGPWDRYFTVTNDAANVVRELASRLKGRRLIYFDSEGELDELLVRDGKFAGFNLLQELRNGTPSGAVQQHR